MIKKLYPDSKLPKAIALVWPDKELQYGKETNSMQKFYQNLIDILYEKLPEKVEIIVYFNDKKSVPGFIKDLSRVQVRIYQESNDIWIRDFAPLWGEQEEKLFSVKGTYFPWYGDEEDEEYSTGAENDNALGLQIGGGDAVCQKLKVEQQEIFLDGGNFIHNGAGIGICTNRIICDNENFFVEDIMGALCKAFGLSKLIILPVEPGDQTGHIDGLCRFIDEKTVIVSEYPYDLKDELDLILIHEMIHSLEYRLTLDDRYLIFHKWFQKAEKEIKNLEMFISSDLYERNKVESHSLFFLIKTLLVDKELGIKYGSIFGYGKTDDFKNLSS